jgi:PAS domain S-box-containing protein
MNPSQPPAEALLQRDARYRAFVRDSAHAIWRFEFTEPIPTALPADEQVARALRTATLAECNDAMARMYGYASAADIIGTPLADLLVATDEENLARLRAFVEAGYRLDAMETHERDRDGRDKYFVNSLVGIVENGLLLGAWGTQRDITEEKAADRARDARHDVMTGALERLTDLQARLTALTDASGELLRSLETGRLPAAIVRVARTLVDADAAAVWLLAGGQWSVAAQEGLSAAFNIDAVTPGDVVEFDGPVQIDDVETAELVAPLRQLHRREGIRSLLIVPLRISGSNTGAIAFYHRQPRAFSDVETRVAAALGSVAASALHIAHLYAERAAAAQRATFLARAGALLSSTLDVSSTLAQVAVLAVPNIADWCVVHLVRPDGTIEPLVAAHLNAEKMQWAQGLFDRYLSDQSGRTGISQVIRTGDPQLMRLVTDDMLRENADDEEHLGILRDMAIRSVIIIPMIARGRTVGAITFVATAESGRLFGDEDMLLAQQLASRAAIAAENARLYEEAQEANRLKDEFFATLSHELRTPINAVLGWAQLLMEDRLSEAAAARAVRAISRNARAQAQLLSDILEMSRIISGKIDLALDDVELADLVREQIESLRPAFDAKSLDVREALAPGVRVRADRARLQQVLFNLLSNAAKFTPDGGSIDVTVEAAGGAAEIRVADTGAGIAPDFLPHVFERFRQGDGSATREHGGLGIGLAVSRHLVELHGGTIAVQSDGPGRGAVFTVRLPLI